MVHHAVQRETQQQLLLVRQVMTVVVHIPGEIEIDKGRPVQIQEYIRTVVQRCLIERISLAHQIPYFLPEGLQVLAVVERVLESDEPPVGI